MIVIKKSWFTLIFGSKKEAVTPESCNQYTAASLKTNPAFSQLLKQQECTTIVQLHQIHSNIGVIITTDAQAQALAPHSQEGDFMITSQPQTALSLLTADCLPIIIAHEQTKTIAAIHAGWKGISKGIIPKAITILQKTLKVCPSSMEVFIGPSARSCCYEIQNDFMPQWKKHQTRAAQYVIQNQNRQFFDLVGYVLEECKDKGISEKHIDITNAHCTLCNSTLYCSARAHKTTQRNVSLVIKNQIPYPDNYHF